MTYYSDEKVEFTVDGQRTLLTEDHAEALIADGYKVEPVWTMENALPAAAANDYLDCTCPDDPPNGSAPLCVYCKRLVKEDIPFQGRLV